jgi:tetratricopeptide (TPR) repeat protein
MPKVGTGMPMGGVHVSRFRSGSTPVEQVGRELGVRYVLEGTVRCIGRRIRVSVELADVVGRQVLWAERYERPLDDGFEVEDDIVAEVLRALDVELASGVRHRSLHSLEAVDLFYRGLSHFYLGTREDNAAAREAFAELTELQSDSPTGPAYVCFTHWNDAVRGWTTEREQSMALAEHWARRAVALWGNNGLAHIVLASVHLLNRRHDEALAECSRAVQLRPNCATANCYLGTVLGYCGRPAEAITKVKEAIRIAPACPPWYITSLAMVYRDSGAVEDAIAAAEKALSAATGDRDLSIVLCSAYVLAGQVDRARRMANDIVSADPSFCVSRFAESQPYREQAVTDRLIAALKGAGLPE